mmetsp:Transcript_5471/g.10302  ORF Transcript_5471/g.10302 Transcript_5471/m.10302 type:complete len:423 (-) Transcript_5471:164-1432(-)
MDVVVLVEHVAHFAHHGGRFLVCLAAALHAQRGAQMVNPRLGVGSGAAAGTIHATVAHANGLLLAAVVQNANRAALHSAVHRVQGEGGVGCAQVVHLLALARINAVLGGLHLLWQHSHLLHAVLHVARDLVQLFDLARHDVQHVLGLHVLLHAQGGDVALALGGAAHAVPRLVPHHAPAHKVEGHAHHVRREVGRHLLEGVGARGRVRALGGEKQLHRRELAALHGVPPQVVPRPSAFDGLGARYHFLRAHLELALRQRPVLGLDLGRLHLVAGVGARRLDPHEEVVEAACQLVAREEHLRHLRLKHHHRRRKRQHQQHAHQDAVGGAGNGGRLLGHHLGGLRPGEVLPALLRLLVRVRCQLVSLAQVVPPRAPRRRVRHHHVRQPPRRPPHRLRNRHQKPLSEQPGPTPSALDESWKLKQG